MNNINRYLKIARNAVIQPSDNIDKKIINRISHISRLDEKLLDDRFLDYFKKNNSRAYLVIEKIRNHPGAFAALAIAGVFIIVFIALMFKIFLDEERIGGDNHQLSSSKDDTQ